MKHCFRFAPRDSLPSMVAKICSYLRDHPGWSEDDLKEIVNQLVHDAGVQSFNGRTGDVVLTNEDVNNLKIATAYFGEGDETIDDLNIKELYANGVRFVFVNYDENSSSYLESYVLDYFASSDTIVYYPISTASDGSGAVASVNGKTGVVTLDLADVLGTSGAQVKLCNANEFTSTVLATWNAYYDSGYRVVGVVNDDATAVDYLYLLKQDKNNHHPIGLTTGSGAVDSVNGKTGTVIVGEASVVKKESDANQYTQIFVDESEDYPSIDTDSVNLLDVYPVGSIYMSVNSTSPASLFGGTWEQIKGRFLLGTGTPEANSDETSPGSYDIGLNIKGGASEVTLTSDNIPMLGIGYKSTTSSASGTDRVLDGNALVISARTGDWPSINMKTTNAPVPTTPPYLAVNMWKRVS